MNAVQFDEYGDVDVLDVRDIELPAPGPGHATVAMKAAGVNPGEANIRKGLLHERWPATFPSGQGSDLAGVVTAVGPGVDSVAVGDEVFGWTDERGSHAEQVNAPAEQLLPKPAGLSWEVAGALHVAGATAWAGVEAVGAGPGETVVVSGAAGGVGSLTVQLAVRAGATVIGLASEPNHEWLRAHGVIPVAYGDGVVDRIRAAATPTALIDTYGGGYVALAIDELGLAPDRVNTIIDWDAIGKYGVKSEGNATGARPEVIAELGALAASGDLDVPIAKTYPLTDVRAAFRDVERRHTRGKIVLVP